MTNQVFDDHEAQGRVTSAFTYDPFTSPGIDVDAYLASLNGQGDVGLATWAAQRYLAAYGHLMRHIHIHRRDVQWNGRYWKPDTVQEAQRLAQELIVTLYREAALIADREERKKAMAKVEKLDTPSVLRGIAALAAQWCPIRAEPSDFDRDPWLATVANGTLDLRLDRSPDGGTTALLRPHAQADMLTRCLGKGAELVYDPDARCPNWEAFLARIFVTVDGAPDTALIAYLQRWFGYVLTGLTTEQILLVCYGDGQNGKRVFARVIEEILGAYAGNISIETLLAQRFEGNAGPAELARLDGARFVQTGENDEGRALNEARIKLLTGGDPITARHLRGDPFDYLPQFKLLIHTNHKPKIRGRDKGIWRRVKLIPFTVTIPEDERDKLFFEHKLAGELAGILAWAVRGCLDWQQGGLREPPTVTAATDEYKQDEDIVRQFAHEEVVKDTSAVAVQKDLFAEFQMWCKDNSIPPRLSSRTFAERLRDATGCISAHTMKGQAFLGIRVRVSSDPPSAAADAPSPQEATEQ